MWIIVTTRLLVYSTVPPLAVIVTRYALSNTSSNEGSVPASGSTWVATRVTSPLPPTPTAVPKSFVPGGEGKREREDGACERERGGKRQERKKRGRGTREGERGGEECGEGRRKTGERKREGGERKC